jgi:hypothetical protein
LVVGKAKNVGDAARQRGFLTCLCRQAGAANGQNASSKNGRLFFPHSLTPENRVLVLKTVKKETPFYFLLFY